MEDSFKLLAIQLVKPYDHFMVHDDSGDQISEGHLLEWRVYTGIQTYRLSEDARISKPFLSIYFLTNQFIYGCAHRSFLVLFVLRSLSSSAAEPRSIRYFAYLLFCGSIVLAVVGLGLPGSLYDQLNWKFFILFWYYIFI